jgi:hypothetical protein
MATGVNPVRVEPITFPLVSTLPVLIGTHRRYHWTKWALAIGVIVTMAEVPSMLSEDAYFADFSRGHPMNDSNSDINNLRQLAHILADPYENALMHDSSNADLEAKDLVLESASIRFSSRMLYEITKALASRMSMQPQVPWLTAHVF